MRAGTVVDAAIIAAPSSIKNAGNAQDPEMHQTGKGNAWHLGVTAYAGVNAESGLIHVVVGAAANVHDATRAGMVMYGDETTARGDAD